MTEKINVTLTPQSIRVSPGKSVDVTATVKNVSEIVESYSIVVDMLEPHWFSLSVSSLSLFPGDEEQVKITVQPPPSSESRAGTYDVQLKVVSNRDPSVMATTLLTLEVERRLDFSVSLSPRIAKGRKGSYRLSITNSGNVPTTYTMAGQDPGEMCRYEFKQDTVAIQPGARVEVPFVVRPKKRLITGSVKNCSFKVSVTPHASEAGEAQVVEGQLECVPLLPKWALAAGAAGIAILIVLIVLLAQCGSGAPPLTITISPENPTASANVTFTVTSDVEGLTEIELYINEEKHECPYLPCSYTGGPYPEGMLQYHATATELEGGGTHVSTIYELQIAPTPEPDEETDGETPTPTPTITPTITPTPTPTPTALPTICLEPAVPYFRATEGCSNPPTQTLRIWNCGTGTLSYSIEHDATWLSLSQYSGTPAEGWADSINVNVDITGLGAGTHSANLHIDAADPLTPDKYVTVTLSIRERQLVPKETEWTITWYKVGCHDGETCPEPQPGVDVCYLDYIIGGPENIGDKLPNFSLSRYEPLYIDEDGNEYAGYVGFVATATFNIPDSAGRTVYFTVGGDNGFKLDVDNERLTKLEDWSIHLYYSRNIECYLEQGLHTLNIHYFERCGDAKFTFQCDSFDIFEWEEPAPCP